MDAESKREQVNHLVEKYISYAEALARSLASQIPMRMEIEEIVSLAHMGLLEAAQKFDASRRVSFKTFAYYRIRGAVYDGMRASGPLSREQLIKYRFQRNMDSYLQQQSDAQISSSSARQIPDLNQLKDLVSTMTSVYLLSMDSTLEHREIASEAGHSPFDAVEKSEAITWLRTTISSLPEQEQTIIRKYYYENKTLDEIGQDMNLSKSWVCRIHARIVKKLQQIHKKNGISGKTSLRV